MLVDASLSRVKDLMHLWTPARASNPSRVTPQIGPLRHQCLENRQKVAPAATINAFIVLSLLKGCGSVALRQVVPPVNSFVNRLVTPALVESPQFVCQLAQRA